MRVHLALCYYMRTRAIARGGVPLMPLYKCRRPRTDRHVFTSEQARACDPVSEALTCVGAGVQLPSPRLAAFACYPLSPTLSL